MARNKENYNSYMKEYMLRRYNDRRQKSVEKLGGICVHCGTVENLELDHIDPNTKSFAIAKMWSVSEEKFWTEVSKCQLLCKTCHILKSHKDAGTIPGAHGRTRYRQGCRCDICRTDQMQANKEWKSKKK